MHPGGKILMSVSGGVVLFAAAYPHVVLRDTTPEFWALPPRHHVIDSLTTPIQVRGWTSEGFITVRGDTVRVPGIALLPAESPILNEIIHRGVEGDPSDGRLYGLMPIWHECGNDPIALHLARVDIATVLRVAEESADCNEVTEQGWDAGCFYEYEGRIASATRSK